MSCVWLSVFAQNGAGQVVCGSRLSDPPPYKGVAAYSNGTDTGQTPAQSCRATPKLIVDPGVGGQEFQQMFAGQDGEQYQCVELIRRFYREAVCSQRTSNCAVPPSPQVPGGIGWYGQGPLGQYGNAQDFYLDPTYFGLVSFANGRVGYPQSVPPQPDDIIAFAESGPNPPVGHVAIVSKADLSACIAPAPAQFTLDLLEQNTNRPHTLSGTCQWSGTTYNYQVYPRCPTAAACTSDHLGLPIQGWLRLPLGFVQPWAHTWGGSGSDSISSVMTDGNGNVYAAGTTSSFGAGGTDVLVLKYDANGNLIWQRTWGGAGADNANGIGLDMSGNVYVVGSTTSFGAGSYDALVLKFDGSGNFQWSKTWGGGSFDVAYDIAFDIGSNLYVAAESYSLGNRAVLLKFDPSGNLLSSRAWKGPATYDSGYSVDVDMNGNVILAGTSWDYSVVPNHNSILLIKFDNQGNFLWHENLVSGAEDEAGGSKIVRFGSSGNIIVAGHRASVCRSTDFSTCDFDADVIDLDSNGNVIWARSWGGSRFESVSGLVLDQGGDVILTGFTNSFLNSTTAAMLIKFDSSGNLLHSHTWGGNGGVTGSGAATDSSGAIFTGGSALNASGIWQDVTGTSSPVTLSITTTTGKTTTSSFGLGAPSGTVTSPTGVLDTGGGGQDTLVLKMTLP